MNVTFSRGKGCAGGILRSRGSVFCFSRSNSVSGPFVVARKDGGEICCACSVAFFFSLVLGHEVLVEFGEVGEHVGHVLFAWEEGESDVPCVWHLSESRSRDGADAGGL